ncbi:hypothetical protein QQ045_025355 [Rhodiola kirilowii]
MGRAPCCDKANVKKGPWSPEEDTKLKDYIEKNGTGGNWISLPQKAGLRRCGKSCRLRWLNYLRPNIRHGEFSEEEDRVICTLYATIGSRWSIIAAQLPGRTDNDIKNYWNTKLKKKLMAFAASSTSATTLNGSSSFQRSTTTKPPSMHPSSPSHLSSRSLYSYSYTSNLNTNSNTNTTPSCLDETSLSLFQNQQYYQPLMFGISADQQTSCSSNNSDNGGRCGINKQDIGRRSFQNLNNNNNISSSSDNNVVVISNGFDEQDENKSTFMLNGYQEISNNAFLSQFDDNMKYSSSTDVPAAALMDLYEIEGGDDDKQQLLNMNINDLSLINIADHNQNHQQVISSTKITSQDQTMMIKDKDQRMMMYYFNTNYC